MAISWVIRRKMTAIYRKCAALELESQCHIHVWINMIHLYKISFTSLGYSNWSITVPVYIFVITMTSCWARWRLKSPASRLFTQPFIQAQIKENISAPRHWPLSSVNFLHKGPVTRKTFPFGDVIIVQPLVMLENVKRYTDRHFPRKFPHIWFQMN